MFPGRRWVESRRRRSCPGGSETYLVSADSEFLTGAAIDITGGAHFLVRGRRYRMARIRGPELLRFVEA